MSEVEKTLNKMDGLLKEIEEKKKSTITLSMFGVEIPLEKELNKAIKSNLIDKIDSIIKDDKIIKDVFATNLLRYKVYIGEILKPIVRDIISDMDFKAELFVD